MSHQYVWLAWSSAFMGPWIILYVAKPAFRREMIVVSLATGLLGFTEPVFVPEYWNPPSLLNLAQRTGFDIESLIFCFAIGGIAAVLYNALARRGLRPVAQAEMHLHRHRYHRLAIAAPFLSFPVLYVLPWNPIYPGIIALAIGAAGNILCRPDLLRHTVIGGGLFLVLYAVFMAGLRLLAPGYIEQVWNLPRLSGIVIGGIPVEEPAFGFTFGLYWTGVYEHIAWKREVPRSPG